MTKLLEQAFKAAQNLPSAMQDDLARIVLQFTGEEQAVIQLTPEEDAALARSEAAAARGEFATDAEVRAVWSKHGL
jgi:predicted transcriptional regulator